MSVDFLQTARRVCTSDVFFALDSAYLNDFYVFDTTDMTWTELTRAVGGAMPSSRHFFGVAWATGKLYVRGGAGQYGLSRCVL